MGKTSGGSGPFGGRASKYLLEAKMFGLPDEICEDEYDDRYDGVDSNGPFGSMMCAGQYAHNQKETSTCGGDSGGPLYSADPDMNDLLLDDAKPPGQDVSAVLVGITSWGRKSCEGGVDSPSVFARVGTVVDWFGPEVCSFFENGNERPGWCDICQSGNGNDDDDKPGWCGNVVPPAGDARAPPGSPPTESATTTSTSPAGGDGDDSDKDDDSNSGGGGDGTPGLPFLEEEPSDSKKTPSTTTTTTAAPNDAPGNPIWGAPPKSSRSSTSTTAATTTIDDKDLTPCQREARLEYCTTGNDMCKCGFINALKNNKKRRGVCGKRGSPNWKKCPLACRGSCKGVQG